MNWLNIHTPSLRSHLFIQASNDQLGMWLRLFAYCAEQENGGMIAGGDKWPETAWVQMFGVTRIKLREESPLWHFNEMGTLFIHEYPLEREEQTRSNRRVAKLGGLRGGVAKSSAKSKAARVNGKKGGRPPSLRVISGNGSA